MSGEFTRKINQVFLKKTDGIDPEKLRREEAERKKQLLADSAQSKVQEEIKKIVDMFNERSQFIKDRFPNAIEEKLESPVGIRFRFDKNAKFQDNALLEFRCKDNELHQALFVENTIIIGKNKPKNDYITFSINKLDPARIRKFIESKILAFVQDYI